MMNCCSKYQTCIEQPGGLVGASTQPGFRSIQQGLWGAAKEESRFIEAIVHKSLADAGIGGHVAAELGQRVQQAIALHNSHMPK